MNEKCFCHLNGYAVKDATARKLIASLQEINTITGGKLRFFVGTKAEYNTLSEDQKQNLFAIITDDTTKADLENLIESVKTELQGSIDNTNDTMQGGFSEIASDISRLFDNDEAFGKFNGPWIEYSNVNTVLDAGTYQFQVEVNDDDRTMNTSFTAYFDGEHNMNWCLREGEYKYQSNTYPVLNYIYRMRIWASGTVNVHRSSVTEGNPWATLELGSKWNMKYRKIHKR